ncbi:polyferredoxin [Oleiphilus messinensis]|uniref:Polyferredoxin n=1 Tax=Oleiphilus messinensis TaxID=141451 RepID=A0A1Y0I6U3_9GAMM|nr:cytochrome c oxidase accessory protein CcoG [Oleiphilus messinensis]ARU55496.1 polyferredoxin [Oleiphilus messinensis]
MSQIPVTQIENDGAPRRGTHNGPWFESRKKIYVREVKGVYQRIRSWSLSVLLLSYFGLCWIQVEGSPLIHFDLPNRKFTLFGTVFWPQDFALLGFALIICAFGLFFITALFGRVWCGYSCPQTVWTFMFMWLEERIEGSRQQRIRLDKSPLSGNKALRKVLKHLSWLVLAFATGFSFVGYFYPAPELARDLFTFSLSSGWALFWILFFTVATYINAGWLREQVCLYMCPYARFQSVMFNEDTLVIGYDALRGEPRGKYRALKNDPNPEMAGVMKGDCVDCRVCVQVCPTGIDIRDGLQYECIGCALCIDACDEIMEKLEQPKGLIRYASERQFQAPLVASGKNWRALGYGGSLMVAIFCFLVILMNRPLVELEVHRDRGALYQVTGVGDVENNFALRVINKQKLSEEMDISISGVEGRWHGPSRLTLSPGEMRTITGALEVKQGDLQKLQTPISFHISSRRDGGPEAHFETLFWRPVDL